MIWEYSEIVDETIPDYDFEELWKANQENLIGKYIEAFGDVTAEYEALCEEIPVLMAKPAVGEGMKIKEIEIKTLRFQIRDLCFGTGSKCSMEK